MKNPPAGIGIVFCDECNHAETEKGDSSTILETPIGALGIRAGELGVREILFGAENMPCASGTAASKKILADAANQLKAYFRNDLREFEMRLTVRGTEFQMDVWRALAALEYNERISYGELAKRIGRPKAVRAVARANGANHVPIVLPCHRVIGADGSLTGFGGGLWRKRALLDLESGANLFTEPANA